MGFPGERGGLAIWDVLFGAVPPSGKMPHSMPNKWNEAKALATARAITNMAHDFCAVGLTHCALGH